MTEDEKFKSMCLQRRESIKGGLRAERGRASLSQDEVSKLIHANQSTISGWEKGDGAIGFEEAWRLADLYGISLDQLAGRSFATGAA